MLMAGTASVQSIAEAKRLMSLHCPDIAISSHEGEYRVNFRNGREATAYYTTDLTDAVGTAIQMTVKEQNETAWHHSPTKPE
jgi:hypothetical protein